MQARFWGLDGRPKVLSIRRSRVDWEARKRAFGTIILYHEPVTVAACHNRDDTPRDKKILAAPRTTINSINSINSTVGELIRSFWPPF